ncbi:MAG: hypothetical protein HXX10_22530 [Rhodoplanes sp.]|uniref:hypothetical protein n=1 Tax=Rhodoplanes sp. TaxID=1968906 RepID=UPI0017C3F3BC|nr:hypothetical protein [Rhodoplanes sp.]NVO16811.1 hypothetical protein [Rhodoplanes sp.]
MSTWPTANDYSLAVARRAFVDRHLDGLNYRRMKRVARPVLFTGNFSATFALEDQHGEPKALKLFTRHIADRGLRYGAIAEFLGRLGPRSFVGFAYLETAVEIEHVRYPGLLMDWAHGATLDAFIVHNLETPEALRKVALELLAFADLTEQHGFAHGDLQHENIRISDRLRLIDYDGMYVPALAGRPAAEHGHLNYQHPGRRQQAFGPTIDRFPAIAIYLCLYTAIVAPHLYRSNVVENGLLFSKADFENPTRSAILSALRRTRGLERAARAFSALCQGSVDAMPSLSDFAARTGIDLRRRTSRIGDLARALSGLFRSTASPARTGLAGEAAAPQGIRVRRLDPWRPLVWAAVVVALYAGVVHLRPDEPVARTPAPVPGPIAIPVPVPVPVPEPVPTVAAPRAPEGPVATDPDPMHAGSADRAEPALRMSEHEAACGRSPGLSGPDPEGGGDPGCGCADIVAPSWTPQSRQPAEEGPAPRAAGRCAAPETRGADRSGTAPRTEPAVPLSNVPMPRRRPLP